MRNIEMSRLRIAGLLFFGLMVSFGWSSAQFLQWNYTNIITDTVESGAYSDMKVAPDGTIHISYWQRIEDKLIYAWKGPSDITWHREYVDPSKENGFRSSICLDALGAVHIAYYEKVSGSVAVRFAKRMGPNNWLIQPLPDIYGRGYGDYGPLGTITTKERVQHNLELIFDENNKPQIVFFDGWMELDAFPACLGSSQYGFKMHQGIRVNNQWLVRSFGKIADRDSSCNTYAMREPLPSGDRYGDYLDLLIEPDGTMDVFSTSRFNNQIIRHRTLFPYVDTVWNKTNVDSIERMLPGWLGGWPSFNRFYSFEGLSAKIGANNSMHLAYTSSIFYGDNFCCLDITNDLVYTRINSNGSSYHYNFGTSTYRNYTDIATRGTNDSIFILYSDLSSLYFIVQQSNDAGLTWAADTIMSGIGIGKNHLEIVGDSLLALLFDTNNERLVLAKRHVNDQTWRIEEVTHSQARGYSMDANVVLAGPDTIAHLAYNDGYTGKIYYARAVKAANWNWAIQELDPLGADAIALSLANTVAGEPIIVYNGGTGRDLRMAVHQPSGWQYEVILPSGNPQFTDVAISSLDSIHVVYYDGNQDCIHHAVRHLTDVNWVIEDIACDTNSVGLYPSLVLDGAGLPHVSYYNDINRSLYYAYLDAGTRTWVIDSVNGGTSSAIGKFSSLRLGTNGLPKIAYLDEQRDAVLLSEMAQGGQWTHTVVDSQSVSNIGRPIDLQIDDFGKVWIAYNFFSNFEKIKLLHRDGSVWREVAVSSTGRIANAFKFRVLGGDLMLIGKKNQIQNTGVGMLYSKNGVFVEAAEANILINKALISSFPNPSTGNITFRLEVEEPMALSLVVFDLVGKRVAEIFPTRKLSAGTYEFAFDGAQLPSGIYLYALSSEGGRKVSKLVIAR